MAQTPDVKITVVGNARVGKTALLMAYTVRKPTHRRWPVCDWFVCPPVPLCMLFVKGLMLGPCSRFEELRLELALFRSCIFASVAAPGLTPSSRGRPASFQSSICLLSWIERCFPPRIAAALSMSKLSMFATMSITVPAYIL